MQLRYTAQQISRILDQAIVYQCACPAQVCRAIFELRGLYDYQLNCSNDTENDRLVHESIARATMRAHESMEECLGEVLALEGWDPETLTLPDSLRGKSVKSL